MSTGLDDDEALGCVVDDETLEDSTSLEGVSASELSLTLDSEDSLSDELDSSLDSAADEELELDDEELELELELEIELELLDDARLEDDDDDCTIAFPDANQAW